MDRRGHLTVDDAVGCTGRCTSASQGPGIYVISEIMVGQAYDISSLGALGMRRVPSVKVSKPRLNLPCFAYLST